jgi:hypothetical protein
MLYVIKHPLSTLLIKGAVPSTQTRIRARDQDGALEWFKVLHGWAPHLVKTEQRENVNGTYQIVVLVDSDDGGPCGAQS